MHPLQTTMTIGITSFVLVSALLLFIRKMPSRPGVDWWLASMVIVAFSYLLALIFFGKEKTLIGELIFVALQLSTHIGIVIGTLLFFGQKVKKNRYFLTLIITASAVLFSLISSFLFGLKSKKNILKKSFFTKMV